MKILFLTRDYKSRSDAYTLYFPLWKALRNENVTVFERDTLKYGHTYEPKILKGHVFDVEKLDYDWVNIFDWVIVENFFPYWFEDWDKIQCKKALILEDIHDYCIKYVNLIRKKTNIDIYLTHYLYPYIRDYNHKPYFWFPHCASSEIFYPRKKTIDVLFTGTVGGCYELRDKIVLALKDKPYFKRIKRRINREMAYPYGMDYGELLGSAKISFATSSTYKYMIAKYFEIIASGTLLIANTIPELKMAGFEPNVNYVELDWNCSKNDIIELVEYYLNHDEEREMIIKNALELSKNHTPEIRAKQIGEALWQ
jgi:hypothetical protein